jgi:hypothetical protein
MRRAFQLVDHVPVAIEREPLIAHITTAGRRLRAGRATGYGLAWVKRHGRTVGTKRWSAKLTLG